MHACRYGALVSNNNSKCYLCALFDDVVVRHEVINTAACENIIILDTVIATHILVSGGVGLGVDSPLVHRG